MGSHDPDVRAAVEQVTRERIDYVAALIEHGGLNTDSARTRPRAVVVYQTYLGGAHRAASSPQPWHRRPQAAKREADR